VNLPDALSSIHQLAFDTAPIIYFVEKHPIYFERMQFVMEYVDDGLITGVVSVMLLAEVLVQPIKTGNHELAHGYESVLMGSRSFRVESIVATTARLAAELRAGYNLRTPDALHLATAIDTGCDAFLTNDLGLKRVTEIPILVLDELEIPSRADE
jgi:predicted nucleic acid-binding protein